MRNLPRYLVLMLPLAILACEAGADTDDAEPAEETAPAQMQQPETQMDEAAIDEAMTRLRDAWVSAATAGDAAAIAGLYADDAVFVGAAGDRMEGRDAIQQGLAEALTGLTSMEVNSLDREVSPDLIADMGTYTQTLEGDQGEQTVEGYYIAVSRPTEDGGWEIVQHLAAPVEGAHSGGAAAAGGGETGATDEGM